MIIGLTGKAGSGKDTVCQVIAASVNAWPKGPCVERIAFADPLKQFVSNVFDVGRGEVDQLKLDPQEVFWVFKSKKYAPKRMTMREMLQRVGTEGGRKVFGDNFWVDQSLPKDLDHSGRLLVVTDLRFENEAQRIKDLGGIIYQVVGPTSISTSENAHSSEDVSWADSCEKIGNVNRDSDSMEDLAHKIEVHVIPTIHEMLRAEKMLDVQETGTNV